MSAFQVTNLDREVNGECLSSGRDRHVGWRQTSLNFHQVFIKRVGFRGMFPRLNRPACTALSSLTEEESIVKYVIEITAAAQRWLLLQPLHKRTTFIGPATVLRQKPM